MARGNRQAHQGRIEENGKMKTFGQYLTEATATGDCLHIAGQATVFFDLGGSHESIHLSNKLHSDGASESSIRLVHAFVDGQGHLNGYRFVHAWVEHRGHIYDFSNGKEFIISTDMYYAVGGVRYKDKEQYRKYTVSQARKKIGQTRHWGPWDLNMKHEKLNNDVLIPGDPISVWNEEQLEEARKVFPKTMQEVGRHKVRLTRGELEDIK